MNPKAEAVYISGMEQGMTPIEARMCAECRAAKSSGGTMKPQFVNIKTSVMKGAETIATCRSVSMAKRIAAALNWYKPGPRGT